MPCLLLEDPEEAPETCEPERVAPDVDMAAAQRFRLGYNFSSKFAEISNA